MTEFSVIPLRLFCFYFDFFVKCFGEGKIYLLEGEEIMEEDGIGQKEWLLWLSLFRKRLSHSFWKAFRQKRCRILRIEHYTIAERDQVLIVIAKVISGIYKGKQWKLILHYNPVHDPRSREAAIEVRRQIQELIQTGGVDIYTRNFYYSDGFLDYLRAEHLSLSRIANPLEYNFRFAVDW